MNKLAIAVRRQYFERLVGNRNAHITGSAFDDPHGRLNVIGIEIRHFGLGDLFKLISRDRTNLFFIGLARTSFNADRFF